MSRTYTLYHGTTPESAAALVADGWQPRSAPSGGNCGNPRYLYLSSEFEDALWFSQQKGCDVVLQFDDVPEALLAVDPEDGTEDTVSEELDSPYGMPGKVVLLEAVPSAMIRYADRPVPFSAASVGR